MKIDQKKPVVDYNRKKITREIELEDWLEGTLKDVLNRTKELMVQYGESASVEYRWVGYEDCECYVTHTSVETDEELQNRVESEEYSLERWIEWKDMIVKKELEKIRLKVEKFEKLKKELEDAGAL